MSAHAKHHVLSTIKAQIERIRNKPKTAGNDEEIEYLQSAHDAAETHWNTEPVARQEPAPESKPSEDLNKIDDILKESKQEEVAQGQAAGNTGTTAPLSEGGAQPTA